MWTAVKVCWVKVYSKVEVSSKVLVGVGLLGMDVLCCSEGLFCFDPRAVWRSEEEDESGNFWRRVLCKNPYLQSSSLIKCRVLATDLLFIDDFGHLFDDFGSLDDLQIFGFEDNEPSDLPDFDFELGNEEFAWMDGPLNIACL
ncbi:Ethylene-responsive transcription factor ERF118 [Camellia lanceoleosa]|uniref:Ethylene-responsive transcription factor ERF118 n=1 Tax=Camellia lanceoleosa TaxID=1840588 RepID=A0ACC0ITZ6_9ERIC|nr:Ethylene-responsive transcription factor ERF118 [Camellia lanceoleosa]